MKIKESFVSDIFNSTQSRSFFLFFNLNLIQKVSTNVIVDTMYRIINSKTSPGILTDKPYNAKGQASIHHTIKM